MAANTASKARQIHYLQPSDNYELPIVEWGNFGCWGNFGHHLFFILIHIGADVYTGESWLSYHYFGFYSVKFNVDMN